jgi:S-adenosylmethionine:diacylglycerol 3-amino-3-carboxypropyl transferase
VARHNLPSQDLPKLAQSDRSTLVEIAELLEELLKPCSLETVEFVFMAFKSAYPNDTIFKAELDENNEIIKPTPLEIRARIAHKILEDVPDWMVETATLEAIRQTARSDNPRARSFMPTDAMILAAAIPHLEPLQAQLSAAYRLINKLEGNELA